MKDIKSYHIHSASYPNSSIKKSYDGFARYPILKIEWLCIQERRNPEVVIILGTVACYRRAKVGSSHDDVHPDNPTPHTGAGTTWGDPGGGCEMGMKIEPG